MRLHHLSLALPIALVSACGSDDPVVDQNIVELAQADARLSTLAGLVVDADLATTLSGGSFTVFAPTNDAFAKIPSADLAALQADTEALTRVLSYHVVSGAVNAEAVTALTETNTIVMETIAIAVADGTVTLTDGKGGTAVVTETDIEATNGVIHIIDSVLMPPDEVDQPGNIVEVATEAGFGSLVSAAGTAGLAATLQSAGPFTVFAPTDAAFTELGAAAPSDPDLLANVLLNHVVAGRNDSAAVTTGGPLTTAANTTLTVDASGSPVTINGFNLSATLDVEASNGIIHVMDQVIVPPSILDVAIANDDLSTLEAAATAASSGVRDTLGGSAAITVFAPVNSAFAKIPMADLNALLADQAALDNVLTYHVATGQTLSGDLADGQVITMANGSDLTVNVAGSAVTLTDVAGNFVNVVTADIRLLNGTVHLIDTVLSPVAAGPGTIVDVATENGSFGTLLGAATGAGLVDTLNSAGPFTVFAPTDAAFTALGVDLTPVSADVIANILLYHVIPGTFDSAAVLGAATLASAANLSVAVDAGPPVTIGGAALSSTLDVPASNGLIHVMDAVIVPPTIVEVAVATPALSTLVAAVGEASAGIQGAVAPDVLTGAEAITVFAPTNDAFVAAGITDPSMVPQATLDAVLGHHVITTGQVLSTDLGATQTVTTANGDITVNVAANGDITVVDGMGNTANVVATLKDLRTLNGVVHVIDTVLMPQ